MNTPFTQNVHFLGAEDVLVKAGSPNMETAGETVSSSLA